jgi:hypothetical protein
VLDEVITEANKIVDVAEVEKLTLEQKKEATELDLLQKEIDNMMEDFVKDWRAMRHRRSWSL